ncbi:MAG: anti-sigma factor antagonist [Solirubrobacteraceae bacterium]|jgi:anti-sigma B factor antagonist|nr:anti-sigma factor antagonist [Solirubrobacteraceae bacterium]
MDARTIALDDSHGDVLVVVVRGEHDIYTAPALRDRLDQALGGTPNGATPVGVIVDLSGATFLDSSILGALLEARRQALEKTLGYVVCLGENPEPGVARILEITGLVPVFPVVRSREEALGAARSAPTDA